MTPADFVNKWSASKGTERQTTQEHFVDLCRLLGQDTPNDPNSSPEFYAFEKGAKAPDGNGFADVWLDKHFAWEYKGKKKDLVKAYQQVQKYREALGNPPLLIVSDIDRFEIHTNWTYTESWIYRFTNADILTGEHVRVSTVTGNEPAGAPSLTALQVLKAIFEDPERLKPKTTTAQITERAAYLFGEISEVLRKWGVEDMRIARFITRVMFCMFATDIRLLPRETFSDVIEFHKSNADYKGFQKNLSKLFRTMRKGGSFSMRPVPFFDGRLFDDDDVPKELTTQEIRTLSELNNLNWTDVEPAIFGTLFVRILDPAQRKRLGAVYTSRDDIELIVEPVLMAPLRVAWHEVKEEAEALLDPQNRKGKKGREKAAGLLREFHREIAEVRILDPACGSGNFLYVALALLKVLEKEVIAFAGLNEINIKPRVHPRQLFGIEINPYAHELASIVVWIGYLQWKYRNALPLDDEEPILQPLDQIALMDAVLDRSDKKPGEPEWPEVDFIIGNPPFVGGKMLRKALGDDYVDDLFEVWDGRVPREADFVCYWFEKARAAIEEGTAERAGLLATQAIRGGKNRVVLERIKETGDIFYAQADRKWIQDGVAVRVSMVGFDDGTETERRLNEHPDDDPAGALARARPVPEINANLTGAVDLTMTRRLKENAGISFMGDTKVGPFEIPEHLARRMLESPNPHGKPNSDVVRPWVNGLDITRRPRGMWIIDFPPGMTEEEAAQYEAPYEYIKKHVKPERQKNKRVAYAERWWIHAEPRPAMREALTGLQRYLATPRVQLHRAFVWIDKRTLPDSRVFVFAREDDYFMGILQSRVHLSWATATSSRHSTGPSTYNNRACFETFPLPQPTEAQPEKIAAAAKELDELRRNWLFPKEPMGDKALKKRTLTNLYNERPAWLDNAHHILDEAVLTAYGWTDSPDDTELLSRLLALNLDREPAGEAAAEED